MAESDITTPLPSTDEERRAYAIKRIKDKNEFKVHLFIYLTVNICLVGIWFFTTRTWFFWPAIPIFSWGIGVVINWYTAYFGFVYTEDQIRRELKHLPQ